MTALLPVLAAMTAVAVAAVLWPLFRRRPAAARSSYELGIYRDQLAEVERDLGRGLVAPEEADAARLEIERRILRAASASTADSSENPGRQGPVLAAALLVPLVTLGLYAALGAPGLPDQPLAARQDRQPEGPGRPEIERMVAQLEERLAGAPDDLEGWLMLARSRGVLGQAPAAVEANRRALALAPDEPRAIAGLGESLVGAAGGVVTPEARGLFARLEGLAPEDPRAGFFLGWADAQAGDYQAALGRWRALLAATPADAPWRERVVEAMREAAGELQLDADQVLAEVPAPPASAPAGPAAPGPSQQEVAQAEAMPPAERQAFIRSMVDKLQARLDADGGDVEGWLRLAQSRLVLGEPDRARAAFERGLALHPDDASLLKGLAGSLLGPARQDTGLPEIGDRAAELYGKVASIAPDDPEPWWYLGIRALQEGRPDEARSSWGKVLTRLDPSRPEYAAIKQRLDQLGG